MPKPIRFTLGIQRAGEVEEAARSFGISSDELIARWVDEGLQRARPEIAASPREVPAPERCAHPGCSLPAFCRGLCRRLYCRVIYYKKLGLLDEGWLVRNGRLLPARGLTRHAYDVPVETLATLPKDPPDDMPETRWLFGWPQAQEQRRKTEATT